LLTGKYHQRTGVWSVTNGFETMRSSEKTIAEILSDAGYATGLFGKWHLGENYPSVPHAQGFDEYIGFRTGHMEDYFDPILEHNGNPYPTRGYITDVITDEAIRFMKGAADKPFFCYVPFNAPHTPLDVPDDYLRKYRGKDLNERVTPLPTSIAWCSGCSRSSRDPGSRLGSAREAAPRFCIVAISPKTSWARSHS
jgi:arylsulfatase A